MQMKLSILAGDCRDAMHRVHPRSALQRSGRAEAHPYSRSIVHTEGYRPRKIAILGPSGAGKTTLARWLSSTLHINAIYLDRLFWKRGWEKISLDDRIDILEQLTQEKQWIIDGTYISSYDLHLIKADTIIFLDIHPLVCFLRILKRYREHGGNYHRRDIPESCADTLTMHRLLNTLFFPFQERIMLEKNLRKFSNKKVIRFHSSKEVEAFLHQPEFYIQEHRHSINILSVLAALVQPYMIVVWLLFTTIILRVR